MAYSISYLRHFVFIAGAFALGQAAVQAEVKLPSVFGDHMVLQQGQRLPVWGWADPGESVTVAVAGQTKKTKAGKDGAWQLRLKPLKASKLPVAFSVKGINTIDFKDVLVGEVWLCSGQSNMEWRVSQSGNAKEEIANGNHPIIRHIKIPRRPSDKPEKDVTPVRGGWEVCSPETVANFTAVGYYFGRHLQGELDVPIGLLGCNWGGTRIEPWTPPTGFKSVPALKEIANNLDTFPQKNGNGSIDHQSALALHNGMISPINPYGIRGALWYQGESNNGEGMLYYEKKKALINGWRDIWNNKKMPFYFVQLAPYKYGGEPTRSGRNLAGAVGNSEGSAHRHGGHHRHRQYPRHSSTQQTGSGSPPRLVGTHQGLWQKRDRVLRSLVQVCQIPQGYCNCSLHSRRWFEINQQPTP